MLNIEIKTVPHEQQRYPTVGDWYDDIDLDQTNIIISDLPSWEFEFLVALHELLEWAGCKRRNIPEEKVTAFDKKYEQKRQRGDVDYESEPGDDTNAPYYNEHQFATYIERLACAWLGIDFFKYEKVINDIYAPSRVSIKGLRK